MPENQWQSMLGENHKALVLINNSLAIPPISAVFMRFTFTEIFAHPRNRNAVLFRNTRPDQRALARGVRST